MYLLVRNPLAPLVAALLQDVCESDVSSADESAEVLRALERFPIHLPCFPRGGDFWTPGMQFKEGHGAACVRPISVLTFWISKGLTQA